MSDQENNQTNVNPPLTDTPEFEVPLMPVEESFTQAPNQSPNNRKKKLVALIIVAFIVVAGVCTAVFAGPKIISALSGKTTDPKERFQEAFTNMVNELETNYDTVSKNKDEMNIDPKNFGMDATLAVKAEQGLSNFIPEEYSFIQSVSGQLQFMVKDQNPYISLALSCNDQALATLDVICDYANKQALIQVPELSLDYLSTPIEITQSNTEEFEALLKQAQSIDPKETIQVLKEENTTFLSHIETVELDKAVSVTANKVTATYDKLTTIITDDKAKQMLYDMTNLLFKKESFIKLYDAYCQANATQAFPTLDEILVEINNLNVEDDESMEVSLYVNSENEMKGIILNILSENDSTSTLSFITAEADKTGIEFKVIESSDQLLCMTGSYTKADEAYTGTLTISIDNDGIPSDVTIDFENVKSDVKAKSFSGSFVFTSTQSMGVSISTTILAKDRQFDLDLGISMGGLRMATITFNGQFGTAENFPAISSDAVIYDAETESEDYIKNSNFLGFLQQISDVTGIDLLSMFYDSILGQ